MAKSSMYWHLMFILMTDPTSDTWRNEYLSGCMNEGLSSGQFLELFINKAALKAQTFNNSQIVFIANYTYGNRPSSLEK
jgi:hypothetical protein